MPGYIIQFYDDTGKVYKEVSSTQPLPVTTVGGGAGGAEEVQITSTGGDAAIGSYGSQASSTVALNTNSRVMGENGANALPIAASNMALDNMDKNSIGLLVNSRIMGYDPAGDNYDRLIVDANKNLLTAIGAIPTVGTQGNAWNAASVSANGNSTAVDCQYTSNVSVFGNTSAATDVEVSVSQDNTNFYKTGIKVTGANGNFYISVPNLGARYVRLSSSAAATITATIAGKG